MIYATNHMPNWVKIERKKLAKNEKWKFAYHWLAYGKHIFIEYWKNNNEKVEEEKLKGKTQRKV